VITPPASPGPGRRGASARQGSPESPLNNLLWWQGGNQVAVGAGPLTTSQSTPPKRIAFLSPFGGARLLQQGKPLAEVFELLGVYPPHAPDHAADGAEQFTATGHFGAADSHFKQQPGPPRASTRFGDRGGAPRRITTGAVIRRSCPRLFEGRAERPRRSRVAPFGNGHPVIGGKDRSAYCGRNLPLRRRRARSSTFHSIGIRAALGARSRRATRRWNSSPDAAVGDRRVARHNHNRLRPAERCRSGSRAFADLQALAEAAAAGWPAEKRCGAGERAALGLRGFDLGNSPWLSRRSWWGWQTDLF